MFGGNSNWRGPIWMPVNMLILRALFQYYLYYGNSFTDRMPDGVRETDEPLRSGGGDRTPPVQDFPEG